LFSESKKRQKVHKTTQREKAKRQGKLQAPKVKGGTGFVRGKKKFVVNNPSGAQTQSGGSKIQKNIKRKAKGGKAFHGRGAAGGWNAFSPLRKRTEGKKKGAGKKGKAEKAATKDCAVK